MTTLAESNARLKKEIRHHKRVQEELETLFNLSMDMLCIAGFDGFFQRLNPAFQNFLGISDEEITRIPFADFIHPDDLAATTAELEHLSTGAPTIRFENRYRRKDGVYRWLEWTARPVPEKGLIYANARDISERKKTREALQESESRKRAEAALHLTQFMVDSAGDAIFRMHDDARFLDVNEQACRTLGYEREDLLNMRVMDIGVGMTMEDFREIWDLVKGNKSYTFETEFRRKDGSVFPVEISANYLEHDDDAYLCAFARDTTERKRAEEALAQKAEALEHSNAELQQFAYVASHDLQEPLRTISSYVQLLHKRYQGQLDEDADDFIDFIVTAAEHMQALIRDLLAYSRVGRREIQRQPVDATMVLERTLAGIEAALHAAEAEVTYDALPTVKADPTQLSLLFQNLVSNGIKFHGEAAPRVHVSAERDGRSWRFAVRDNGIGIKKVYQGRIFEVFRRLHSHSQYAGTGIGLAICKKIIERHGGRIWVESEVDKGATFFFTIPI